MAAAMKSVPRTAEGILELIGDKALIKTMAQMRETRGRRAMSVGAFAATAVLMKAAKAMIPSRYKNMRKGMGRRRLNKREAPGGGAKVGTRVGRSSRFGTGQKGVGISAQNLHWLFAGTGLHHKPDPNPERQTGKQGGPVKITGSTKAIIPPLHVIATHARGHMQKAFAKAAWKDIEKSVKQGKAFGK